jgi:hypothetical protein
MTYHHMGRDWVGARAAGIMDAVDKAVPGGELRLTTTIFGWCVPSESLTPEGKSSEREAPDREREFLCNIRGARRAVVGCRGYIRGNATSDVVGWLCLSGWPDDHT